MMNKQTRLFQLFEVALKAGSRFARLSEIDGLIRSNKSGFFLKHDVHGMSLGCLLQFANREKAMGLYGTYFFMIPGHPLTAKHYSFDEQIEAMLEIHAMGHDIGLHIDPFFLLDREKRRLLSDILKDTMNLFNKYGIRMNCGNIHGNSKFKGLDNNGFGTSFDLFEEIARQPDFPKLEQLPTQTAELIRSNRVRLSDFGFTHWADMPLWSEKHKFIVTNFISDNLLYKKGILNGIVHKEALGCYKLSDWQPPGALTISPTRAFVQVEYKKADLDEGRFELDFNSTELEEFFQKIARHPVQFLVHPQHYC